MPAYRRVGKWKNHRRRLHLSGKHGVGSSEQEGMQEERESDLWL